LPVKVRLCYYRFEVIVICVRTVGVFRNIVVVLPIRIPSPGRRHVVSCLLSMWSQRRLYALAKRCGSSIIFISTELPEGVWASMVVVACVCFFSTLARGACRCKNMQEAVERDFACSCMWLTIPCAKPKAAGNWNADGPGCASCRNRSLGIRPRHHPTDLEHKQATDKPDSRPGAATFLQCLVIEGSSARSDHSSISRAYRPLPS
jgi:hypothetical protein